MSNANTPQSNVPFGWLFVAIGLAIIVAMTVWPDGLEVPYWVAVAAASTFSFAGASVVLTGVGFPRLGRAMTLPVLVGLATPGLWILFDPGEKSCTSSGAIVLGAGDLVCRGVFGAGAVIVLLVLALAVVAAVRDWRGRHTQPTPPR